MSAIKEVTALEIMDSRGNPTVEAEVAHPAHDEVAAGPVGIGQGETGAPLLAVGPLDRPDLPELDDARPQPLAVHADVGAHGR